ncbi:hypothetical protein Bbelb_359130 [Branchiostoma belcheri]|nr:hypothetical protein Bbelb_359130 [Branchiostoma belcheri]
MRLIVREEPASQPDLTYDLETVHLPWSGTPVLTRSGADRHEGRHQQQQNRIRSWGDPGKAMVMKNSAFRQSTPESSPVCMRAVPVAVGSRLSAQFLIVVKPLGPMPAVIATSGPKPGKTDALPEIRQYLICAYGSRTECAGADIYGEKFCSAGPQSAPIESGRPTGTRLAMIDNADAEGTRAQIGGHAINLSPRSTCTTPVVSLGASPTSPDSLSQHPRFLPCYTVLYTKPASWNKTLGIFPPLGSPPSLDTGHASIYCSIHPDMILPGDALESPFMPPLL